MIWPYDDRGRLVGEDVCEPDPDKAQIVKLDPPDVLTTAEARRLLDSFDQAASGIRRKTHGADKNGGLAPPAAGPPMNRCREIIWR